MFKFTLLRFSGFNDEWETKMLKDVSTINPKTKDLPNEFVYIDLDSVENGILTKKNKICIEDAPSRAQRLLDVNDILFQTVRPYQMNNLYFDYDDDNYVASTGYAQIKSKINSRYLYHYLHYSKFVNEVLKRCTGTSYPAINANDLKKIKIKIPSDLDEQMFIGSIFDRIDEKIELLEKKHQYYQYFKKFLMQQIFAQKLRFNDNNNEPYENWEGLQLKDIISLQGGYAFKSELFKDEGVPIIRISNISPNNSVILDDLVYYDKLDNDSDFIIKKGELIIAMSGATTGKVGVYDLDQIAYINQRVGLFKQISNELYYPFLIQYTLSDTFKRELQKTLVAGAQPNISKKEIESFKINLPQYGEQKKIADLLFNIDLKINTVKNQSTEISQFKKGLLQQMFV